MNAILRECEATVLTHEAIEIHLSYLRPAVEALAEKLDQANKNRIAGDATLVAKIDKTNEKLDQTTKDLIQRISAPQGSIDGLKWFVGSATLLVSGFTIVHELGWI
jgi:hypothetical protein